MKIALYPNFDKSNALSCALSCAEILHRYGAEVFVRESHREQFSSADFVKIGKMSEIASECDIIIAIGGDGTILKCSGYAAKNSKPLLGINTGRLGFMASVERDELHKLERLFSGEYSIQERMMIDVIHHHNGESDRFTALNDVIAARMFSRIADFTVSINGRVISNMRSDGVVFSTPTGSTAYALSAGGPIIEPTLSCIEFASVCPHSLWSRPMLIDPSNIIEVKHCSEDIFFSVDGSEAVFFDKSDKLEIMRSKSVLKLIEIDGGSFYDAVNTKLMRSLK